MTPLNRPETRPAHETIVALVDVVFFLLVFALLVGRMDATAPYEVTPPVAGLGVDMPAGGATVTLGMRGTALDGEEITRTELKQRLAHRIEAEPMTRIRVQADQKLKLQDVLPLLNALEDLGAADVLLIVTPGE